MFTLLIIETVVDDSAKYECVAINSAGEARCEAELIVQVPKGATKPGQVAPGPKQTSADQAKDQAPAVIEPLRDQAIKEGQPVVFRCKITGKPGEYYILSVFSLIIMKLLYSFNFLNLLIYTNNTHLRKCIRQ